MSKKRKRILKKFYNFFIIGGILTSLNFGKDIIINTKKIAEVPWDVRNELYYDDVLNDYDYFRTYGRYTSSGLYLKSATDSDSLLDKYVTYDSLKKLVSTEVHMKNTSDLSFIKKCPKLEEIYIEEAELLTDEDIEIINKSKIKKVVLTFNVNNIRFIKENKFDVSRIKKDVIINNYFYSYLEDLDQLTFYNYLININDNIFSDQKSLESLKKMDNYLDQIIKEYKINEGKDDIEKIMLISNYICNNLEYDTDVSNSIEEYFEKREKENIVFKPDEKIENYNYHSISSVINQTGKEKSGVCINYASLFDILCYKVGVKSRLVDGNSSEYNLGHAWNLVYLNDEKDYIDLTNYDIEVREKILNHFYESRDELSYDLINEGLFESTDEKNKKYKLYTKMEELDKEYEKKYIYNVNEGLDGFYMIKDDIKLKPYLILFLSGGVIGVSLEDIKKLEKRKKKRILKTS